MTKTTKTTNFTNANSVYAYLFLSEASDEEENHFWYTL